MAKLGIKIIIACLVITITPLFIHAQGNISFNISPENPGSGDQVTLRLSRFLTDLDRSFISWSKDGEENLSGFGEDEFTFTVGDVGEVTTINIRLVTAAEIVIEQSIIIRPQDVDLLWEAPDSYVPPFYKGKALPAREAQIKVVAIPIMQSSSGTRLQEKNLVYNWRRGFNLVAGASGHSKSSYLFEHNVFNEKERIAVEVSPLGNNIQASGATSINIYVPEIIFYEKGNLEGLRFEKALNLGFDMKRDRATIVAAPYFFSVKDLQGPELEYNWTINNDTIPTPSNKNQLTLKLGEKGGFATLVLTIKNIVKDFQEATAQVRINLGE